MTWRAVGVAIAAMSLSGCQWMTWIGYNSDVDLAPPVLAAPISTCPKIGVQNLDPVQTIAVTEAVGDICEILASEAFAESVRAKEDWLATCTMHNGQEDAIAAEEVLRIVRLPKEDVSVLDRKPLASIAQIDPSNKRIAIPKTRIRYWSEGTLEQRSLLIQSLAHEFTHFVKEPGRTNFRFTDGGHGKGHCTDDRLASYAVGNMVQELWEDLERGS